MHANVKQASYEYEAVVANQSKDLRATESATRRDFNGVTASMRQIGADARSVQFYQSALKGARAEFQVGTKTLLDVLTQQENLFDAQSTKAHDLYAYITGVISLKQDAGKLTMVDLREINEWLEPEKPTKQAAALPTVKKQEVKT